MIFIFFKYIILKLGCLDLFGNIGVSILDLFSENICKELFKVFNIVVVVYIDIFLLLFIFCDLLC